MKINELQKHLNHTNDMLKNEQKGTNTYLLLLFTHKALIKKIKKKRYKKSRKAFYTAYKNIGWKQFGFFSTEVKK